MNSPLLLHRIFTPEVAPSPRPWHLMVLSAKSRWSLDAATTQLINHLQKNPGLNSADVSFTLLAGRQRHDYCRFLVYQDLQEALHKLKNQDFQDLQIPSGFSKPQITFLFSGQETISVTQTKTFYATEPVFQKAVDHCSKYLMPKIGLDLRILFYPHAGNGEEAYAQLSQLEPIALFVMEYALAQLWLSWGIRPHFMFGQGIGEYVAATLAGVLSLADMLDLAIQYNNVQNDQSLLGEFKNFLQTLNFQPPQMPYISELSGTWITPADITNPTYWEQHALQKEYFKRDLQILTETPNQIFLEVGLGSRVSSFLKEQLSPDKKSIVIDSLASSHEKEESLSIMLHTLGKLRSLGVSIDWNQFFEGQNPRRTPLPSYAFERKRHWFTPGKMDTKHQVHQGPTPQSVPKTPESSAEPSKPSNKASTSGKALFEAKLAQMCQDLLGIEKIGLEDNVVMMGMDSMMVMQLSKQVEETFHITITPHHLFSEPTITSLAEKVYSLAPNYFSNAASEPQATSASSQEQKQPPPPNLAEFMQKLELVENLSETEVDELLASM